MRPPPPLRYDLRFSNTTGIRHQSVTPFLSGTPPTKGRTIRWGGGGRGVERRAKYKKYSRKGKLSGKKFMHAN